MQSDQQVKRGEYRRMTLAEIGQSVRLLRTHAGWKQLTLAFEAGVHERTVQRIERGEKVDDESLRKVGLALRLRDRVFLQAQYIPSAEEVESEAKKALAELTVIQVRGLATLNDCDSILTAHAFLFGDRGMDETLADEVAEFKDLVMDWGDICSDIPHAGRLDACRSVLAVSERIGVKGYKIVFGILRTEDEWRWNVAVMLFMRADDDRTSSITQLVVPRTLKGLETWAGTGGGWVGI